MKMGYRMNRKEREESERKNEKGTIKMPVKALPWDTEMKSRNKIKHRK